MSTFTVLLLCVQACLVQNVLSACYGGGNAALGYGAGLAAAPAAISPAFGCGGYGAGWSAPLGLAGNAGALGYAGYEAAYGGSGEGNVAVIGELPVGGTTAIAGQVPISGAVSFGGAVPAAGAVSISGNCACGCGNSY